MLNFMTLWLNSRQGNELTFFCFMDQARRTQAQTSEGSGIPPGSADVSLK